MKKTNVFGFLIFLSGILFSVSYVWAFDDVQYEIAASFSPAQKTIDAKETLTFKNTSGRDLKEIYLRVYPHHKISAREKKQVFKYAGYFKTDLYPQGFDAGAFCIESIVIAGKSLDPSTQTPPMGGGLCSGFRPKGSKKGTAGLPYSFEGEDQTVLKVVLPEVLKDTQTLSLEIAFSSKIPHRYGRYGWHKNTFALNRWYPMLGFLDKDGWHNDRDYLLHMPYVSDAALYHVTFSMPKDYTLVSGCDEATQELKPDGTKIVSLKSSAPLRELSLAVSRDYLIEESEFQGIKVKSYYFPKDKGYALKALEAAKGIFAFYGKAFGAYPIKQFSIAPVYLGYGGSQNAGMIFIDARAYRMPLFLARYFDFLVAHETGHQWWYHVVGNDEYRELWLDEGLNSYFITRYLESRYGPGGKVIKMPRWMEYFIPNPSFEFIRTYRYRYFSKKGFDQTILSEMSSFYEPSMIFTIAYGKGSAVLGMLAALLGEDKFMEILKKYYDTFRFKNAAVRDFEKIASDVSGRDLTWFFREWLYEAKSCDYALERRNGKLFLKRLGEIAMPVDTTLVFRDGTQEVVACDGKSKEEEIALPRGKELKEAMADRARKILDMDRVDNRAPRSIDVRFVPLYHGLYDVPLFQREDAYSWTTGPSFSQYGIGARTSFQKPQDYSVSAATHYDTNARTLNSSIGFEKNIAHKYLSWGFEFMNRVAHTDEERDSKTYKLYLRQELDLPYSLLDVNSHFTLYLAHNQSLGRGSFVGSREEPRNLQYRQNKETIIGATFTQANGGPFPDPSSGYKLSATQEAGVPILGGADAFTRTEVEFDKYFEIFKGHKIALRFKGGAGHPKDKYLFYLGSDRELRGYDYKDIKGSAFVLGSFEYRFPLVRDRDARLFWQTFNLDQIQGVLFFDAGSAWFNRFFEPGFKKDVGLGLRFYFDVAGGTEKVALRVDVARPCDGTDKDTHIWVGINQAF